MYFSFPRTCFLIFLVSFSLILGRTHAKPGVELRVNWPSYLAKHDLIWNKIPKDYFEGAFVGNGILGTIVFQDDSLANTLRFEIGRTDVYDHRSLETPVAYGRERLPIGQLLLSPKGKILSSQLRTDLWNAEIRGQIKTSAGSLTFRCFVPSAHELIVLQVQATGAENEANIQFRPQLADSPRFIVKKPLGGEKGFTYVHNPPFEKFQTGKIQGATQTLLMGDDYATAWTEQKSRSGERTILLTVANRWAKHRQAAHGSAEDAIKTIQAGLKIPMAEMEKSHRAWWHAYYPASFVSIPEARLESFYWIQLYKLGSATHPNRPVIDLMGPWFKPTQWPCLWMNLNVQLTYYTFGITNHSDLEDNLYQLIDRHQDQLIANVPPEFQADCAAIRNPVGYDELFAPLFLSDDPKNEQEINIIVLPWLMQMYYLHNRRTMDDQRLREKIYPMMRRAYQVYVRILHKEADGKYHIPYTFSDEYGNAKETSLNIALARWGFATLLSTAERLKIKDPNIPIWKDRLANMADYSIDQNGIMIGKDVPFSKPHRHYSHLFSIFPLYEMNVFEDPERISMMRTSVQHFTDLDGDNCMYKFSGASSLWASLGDGDKALTWLNRSLQILPRFGKPPGPSRIPSATRNTMYSERENPTFESPISASRSILDMLFQCFSGLIRIFPAMPYTWKDASFYHLKAEGGFLVSARREKGQTKFIEVISQAGEPCVLQTDFTEKVQVLGISSKAWSQEGTRIRLSLKKGERAILYVGLKPASFAIQAEFSQPETWNAWGLRE